MIIQMKPATFIQVYLFKTHLKCRYYLIHIDLQSSKSNHGQEIY